MSMIVLRFQERFRSVPEICACLAGGIALLAMVGWWSDLRSLAGQWANNVPMSPDTGLAFLLLSGGLFCIARWPSRRASRVFALAAISIVSLLGLLVIVQFIVGVDLGVEQSLSGTNEMLGSKPLGQMSPVTAVSFLLEGPALFLLMGKRWLHAPTWAALLAASAIGINAVVLVGYWYGAPLLHGGTIISVALPTAIAFLFVGVGQFHLAVPFVPALRVWSGTAMRGILLRAFLPLILILILVQGWLDLVVEPRLSLNPALWQSLIAITAGALILVITAWIARRTGGEIDRAQESLAESEAKFRNIFENSPLGKSLTGVDGTLRVNKSFCDIVGYSEEELRTKKWKDVTHPDDIQEGLDVDQSLLDGKIEVGHLEKRYIHKNGNLVWTDVITTLQKDESGNPVYFLTSIRDLSGSKKAEEKLARLTEQYELILNSSAEGIVGLDLRGRHTFVNPSAEEMFGYQPGELLGGPSHRTWHHTKPDGSPYPTTECAIYAAFRDGVVHRSSSEVFWRKDGTSFPVEYASTPIYERGQLSGAVVTFSDITERKRAETERKVIHEIIQGIAATPHLDDYLRLVHGSISQIVYAENFFVMLGDIANKMVHFEFWVDKYDPCPALLPLGKGFSSYVFRTGKALLLNEELKKRMYTSGEVEQMGSSSASWLGVPLRTHSQTIGVLVLQHYEDEHAYSERDLDFLSSVGNQIALAIERKRANEALGESEVKYRTIIQNIEEGYYEVDIAGNLTFFNDSLSRIYGYPVDELTGMNNRDYMDDQNARKVFQTFNKVYRTGKSAHATDYEVIRKDGSRRLIGSSVARIEDATGKIIGFRGIVRDITERKNEEEMLNASEKRFRALVENGRDNISLLASDGTLIWESPSAISALGYEPNQFVGANLFELVHPDDQGWTREILTQLVQAPGESQDGSFRLLHADGTWRWIESTVSNLLDEPSVRGIVINYRDITERKHLEEQLRQSQKLESIGLLAGGIAHDFNNMLTAINGYSDLTLRRLEPDEPIRRNIEEIKKAGERSALLTNQLLAFSRKQILRPELVDINAVINETSNMLKRMIGEDVELSTSLKPKVGKIEFDRGQLSQIIMNLAVNSRDAMPNGGKLTIETANTFLGPEYVSGHAGVLPGAYVMLSVSDTGVGIPPEIQDRIFDPFFTTKEIGKGTGLGLATVYGIVKQSGGNIFVYSEIDHGATFKIYIPWVVGEAEDSESIVSSPGLAVGSETILLAEDEAIVRALSRQALEACGYAVIEAKDGVEALEIFKSSTVNIDLLFTDVVMPRMGGRELVEKVLEIAPGLPVLFASGYTDDAIVRHGVLETNANFIQKPFAIDDVARRVRDLLDGAGKRPRDG